MAQGVPGRLRPWIFLTFRHYKCGRSSAVRIGRLYPRRNPWYSISEAESTSGHMVLSGVPRKKSPVTPPGIDPGTVRLVAQCLNHYAHLRLFRLSTMCKIEGTTEYLFSKLVSKFLSCWYTLLYLSISCFVPHYELNKKINFLVISSPNLYQTSPTPQKL